MKPALVPSCPYPLCCIAGVLCPEWQPSGAHWDLCLPKELQEWESTGTKPEAVLGGTEDSLKHWGFFSLLPCTCALCCDHFTSSMQDSGILSSCCSFYLPCCTESQTTSLWGDTGLRWQQTAKPGWLSEGSAGSGHQQWSTRYRQYFSSNAALTAWATKDFSVGRQEEQDITSLQNRSAFWIQVFQLAQNLCLHYV